MSFRTEVADALRLYRTCFAFFRLAQIEAEALVWHHGREGVAIARAREVLGVGESRVQRLHHWLVRFLAQRSYDMLCRLDIGTRYEVAAAWAGRPGQMIIRRTAPGDTTSGEHAGEASFGYSSLSAPQA